MDRRMKVKIQKLAIANRGEVAVRIHNAASELGITTVLLHSEVDIQSKAFRICDEKICIGPAPVNDSYLHIERVIRGALSAGAQAIHPGFGFLSENAEFASACEKAGILFVGPSPECIQIMGDKIEARKCAVKAGVPVVPGYEGAEQTEDRLLKEAGVIGYPVIIKASGGGGGRGLKVATSDKDFLEQLRSAKREGLSAFKSEKVFLEKYLDHAKHIEFQVFGDATGKVFHLYDRECSVQRRHQKIIEESISPMLSEKTRSDMAADAVRLAELVGYKGAGTVEFIFQDNKYYFMEMNTRLQVEHPVTEEVMGVDLVKAQILCAQGISTKWEQTELRPTGHSIECRIYAEDPFQGGIPSTGLLGSCFFADGQGRRFEVGFEKGDEVTSYYDSMIAKIIVWDETRSRAIQKMIKTLDETKIFGLHTNIPYLKAILNHDEFRDGTMTTQFIGTYFKDPLPAFEFTAVEKEFIEKAKSAVSTVATTPFGETTFASPWQVHWRNS